MPARRFPLLLLHGWAMTPAVWQPLRQTLSAKTVVTAPPLPGHAGAPMPAEAGLTAWAEHLLAFVPEEAVVCGWSLGGLLGLEMARLAPTRIARLALIGATPRFVAAADWQCGLAEQTVSDFIDGYAHAPGTTLRRFLALQALGDTQRQTVQRLLADTLDPAATAAQGETTAAGRGFSDGLRLLADSDLRPRVAAIEQPVLLLHGEHDALMPVAAAQWQARHFPRSELHLLPGCGHAPFLSAARQCACAIGAFCER